MKDLQKKIDRKSKIRLLYQSLSTDTNLASRSDRISFFITYDKFAELYCQAKRQNLFTRQEILVLIFTKGNKFHYISIVKQKKNFYNTDFYKVII